MGAKQRWHGTVQKAQPSGSSPGRTEERRTFSRGTPYLSVQEEKNCFQFIFGGFLFADLGGEAVHQPSHPASETPGGYCVGSVKREEFFISNRCPFELVPTPIAMTPSDSRALLLFLFPVSLLSSLLFYTLLKSHLQEPRAHAPPRNISVLLWRWPFGRSYSLAGDKCLEMYNISRCLLTDNVSAFSTADVVVFHHHELSRGPPPPLHLDRPASQRWVWMSLEPPVNNVNLAQLNGLFNWTMSYRRDADIPIPYGKTLLGGDERGFPAAPNRSCLVSWVVSRYQPQQARAGVYQGLKKHIPIEVYGRWTKRPLSDRKLLPTIAKCLFYLAFENSEAKDYISEKLWRNAFRAGAIPVVLGPGRATYEVLAPPASFIHVADFKSVAELAAHLKRVAADREAYEGYFSWHRSHRVKTLTDWRERLCHICVRYPSLPASRVYQDLEGWVNS